MKVDFMFRLARNFYVGPMAVFDYVYGHGFEKPELWEGMSTRTTNLSVGLSLLYDSRDFLTNAYKGYYLRIDQRFSPAFLGNKYAFSQYRTGYEVLSYHMERRRSGGAGFIHCSITEIHLGDCWQL